MKKIILSLSLLSLFFSLYSFAQENKIENDEGPKMKFETAVIDYGIIEHKSDGQREFIFVNSGNTPLIISNARGSCGCTVPTFPKEPILPGSKGKIGVKYDTKRIGKFTKTITLTTNTEQKNKILTIKGEVLRPDSSPVAPSKTNKSPLEIN